jgi:hypothetical protein
MKLLKRKEERQLQLLPNRLLEKWLFLGNQILLAWRRR